MLRFKRYKETFETRVIGKVQGSEKDFYVIAKKKYRGLRFVDIRIFTRALEDPDRLIPCWNSGIWIEEVFVSDLIAALEAALKAPAVRKPLNPKQKGALIEQIPATEREVYRVYKGLEHVEIRRFMKIVGAKWRPYHTKGLLIRARCLKQVIEVLRRSHSPRQN